LEQLGIPLILVTHDPEEAVRFATVAVPYRKGETGELIDIGIEACDEKQDVRLAGACPGCGPLGPVHLRRGRGVSCRETGDAACPVARMPRMG
jgi:hypothetical protein